MREATRLDFEGIRRFALRLRIGQGAVGDVYEAFDRERNARVALKTLRTLTPACILSLKNEFRTAQDIQHPNLVSLGELFEERGHWFFTMEDVEGKDFLQYVRDVDPAELVRADAARAAGSGFSRSDNVCGAFFQTTNLLLALDAGAPTRILHALGMDICFTCVAGEKTRARVAPMIALADLLAARIATPQAGATVVYSRGYVHYMRGESKEAKPWLSEAEHLLANHGIAVTFELASVRIMLYRTLAYLGELDELGARVPPVFREVKQQGDIHSEINLTNSLALLGLAADAAARVRDDVARARAHLAKGSFLVQHYFCLLAEAQCDLYVQDGAASHERFIAAWPALRRSMLMRVQPIRIVAYDQRARSAIGRARGSTSAGERTRLLRDAERDAARVAREHVPWADAITAMLGACIADVHGDHARAQAAFAAATRAFEAADMGLHAAAARRRQGELMGGEDGAALISTADAWMVARGVKSPAKMRGILAPSAGPRAQAMGNPAQACDHSKVGRQ